MRESEKLIILHTIIYRDIDQRASDILKQTLLYSKVIMISNK